MSCQRSIAMSRKSWCGSTQNRSRSTDSVARWPRPAARRSIRSCGTWQGRGRISGRPASSSRYGRASAAVGCGARSGESARERLLETPRAGEPGPIDTRPELLHHGWTTTWYAAASERTSSVASARRRPRARQRGTRFGHAPRQLPDRPWRRRPCPRTAPRPGSTVPRSRSPIPSPRGTRARSGRLRAARRPEAARCPCRGRARPCRSSGEAPERVAEPPPRARAARARPSPRSTCSGAPLGGGQMLGQSEPASDSRTRWPASNTHDVASSSISISVGTPGSSATGASCPRRWVRLSEPRQTRAEVPSGKTSQSRAATYATGTGDVTVRRTRGCPMTSSSSASGSQSYVSERESSKR